MFKKRIIRLIVGHVFDQLSDETLDMLNEIIDAEIEERQS